PRGHADAYPPHRSQGGWRSSVARAGARDGREHHQSLSILADHRDARHGACRMSAARETDRDEVMEVRPAAWGGVLVPPANPTVEPELARCVDSKIALFAARFPVMPGTALEQRNQRYLELYRES